MGREPLAHLHGVPLQSVEALRGLRGHVGFDGQGVRLAMPFEHRRRGCLELRGLVREVRARPAPMLRRVTREFDAIDGEHLAAHHALRIADGQHRPRTPGRCRPTGY